MNDSTEKRIEDTENIWIIDDDQSIRFVLQRALEKAGMKITAFEFTSDLLNSIETNQTNLPDAIISDIRMPGMSGLDLTKLIHQKHPDLPIIIMTAHSDMDSAMSAYDSGAFEYLPKPFDINEAVELARRACMTSKATKLAIKEETLKQIDNNALQDDSENSQNHNDQNIAELPVSQKEIIGQSAAMQSLFKTIGRLSKTSISVLITGESGTGKELVAKALHTHSPRSHKAFIAINTAAIPKELLESELFGHEKGAFTGAQAQRKGRGNVRQLENVSRWLTVMATSQEITLDDLPPDLRDNNNRNEIDWEKLLFQNMMQRLNRGETRILDSVTPKFESIALAAALEKTGGRKKDAAELLGWGRNTLTRKLKEFDAVS